MLTVVVFGLADVKYDAVDVGITKENLRVNPQYNIVGITWRIYYSQCYELVAIYSDVESTYIKLKTPLGQYFEVYCDSDPTSNGHYIAFADGDFKSTNCTLSNSKNSSVWLTLA